MAMDKQDFILKYLHNELTDKEYESFINLTESDKTFAENVKIESILYAQHKENIKKELRDNSNIEHATSVHEAKADDKTTIRNLFPLIRNIAAVFIFALITYFAFIDKPIDQSDSNSLAGNYLMEFYQAPPSLMSGVETESDTWNIAIESYKLEKFELAVEQIEKIENRTNEQNLYLALSRMYAQESGSDITNAISDFKNILSSNTKLHKDEARWFLALAQLELKNSTEAKQNLEHIVTTNSWNAKKAALLLTELE